MVPHSHHLTVRAAAGGPPLSYWAFIPDAVPLGPPLAPPLVLIHGTARNTGRMFRAFLPMAVAHRMPVIIPRFPTEGFRGYQRLSGDAGPMAARRALDATLTDASEILGIRTARVLMCGFSGGAQFAHRYAMFDPKRITRLAVASAGHYTYLRASQPYPYGVASSALSAGERPDVGGFLRLPIQVLAGGPDIGLTGDLRCGPPLNDAPGDTRLARALRWTDHLEEEASRHGLASRTSFDLLPGTAHSFSSAVHRGDLVARVLRFLLPADSDRCGAETTDSGKFS